VGASLAFDTASSSLPGSVSGTRSASSRRSSAVSVNVSPRRVSVQRSLVGVATYRGAGVLVLLPAFMALQQVVQPVDGAYECGVHAGRVIGNDGRRLTRRSRLDHASDIGAGGSSAALVAEMNLDSRDVV
jgi:hypothetical protein